ncbi:MAG: beta-propeller fold lactonase family protein [Bacteroidota bacterium]
MNKPFTLFLFFAVWLAFDGLSQTAYVTVEGNDMVSAIDVAKNAVIKTIRVGHSPYGVAVSADGSKVYVTNSGSNSVSVINTADKTVTATIGVGYQPVGIAVSPDGKKVYVANGLGNTISVINAATNSVSATINVDQYPYGLVVSPDNKKVYVANFYTNKVTVIDAEKNRIASSITVGTYPFGIAITPDGSKVFVANNGSNNVSVISTVSNSVKATLEVGTRPFGVSISPDGSKAYVANFTDRTVSVINAESNSVSATVRVGNGPRGLSVSPDGTKVFVANENDRTMSIISTDKNTVMATVEVGASPVAFGNCMGPCTPLLPVMMTSVSQCNGDSISTTFGADYLWNTGATTQSILANVAGIYAVTVTDGNGCKASAAIDNVSVSHLLIKPEITQMGNSLISSSMDKNRWYFNGSAILGDTNQILTATINGCYQVMVGNAYGCTSLSDQACINGNGYVPLVSQDGVSIYPNPNTGSFTLNLLQLSTNEIQYRITDGFGRTLDEMVIHNPQQLIPITIHETQGIYFIEVKAGGHTYFKKILIN